MALTVTYARMPGCLSAVLAVATFGVANLVMALTMRRWPTTLDEEGLVLRNGQRVRWRDITGQQEVITQLRGGTVRRMDLHSSKGTIALPIERMVYAEEVMAYVAAHLPANVSERSAPSPTATTSPEEPTPPHQASPQDRPPPPQPGPPGTQTFYCDACGYQWGPVEVRPFEPDAAAHQLFLFCVVCDQPQTHDSAGDVVEIDCVTCGVPGLEPLGSCPGCHDPKARWI